MKKGDLKTIEINGKKLQGEFVGKGRFSTCYKIGNRVFSFVKDCDPGKEILSLWCSPNPYLPSIIREDNFGNLQVYSMPYYNDLKVEHGQAWADYKRLKNLWNMTRHSTNLFANDTVDRLDKFQDLVDNNSSMNNDLKEAIRDLIFNAHNFDEILFEFAIRNLKVDQNNNNHLILLDVLFSRSLVK